jgi:hypothetical protein
MQRDMGFNWAFICSTWLDVARIMQLLVISLAIGKPVTRLRTHRLTGPAQRPIMHDERASAGCMLMHAYA